MEHGSKGCDDGLRRGAYKSSDEMEITVIEHPTRDGRVVHHEHIASYNADPFEMMPAGSLWFQDIKAAGRTAPAAAANTEFTDHHRNAHDQQEKKIDEDKCGTAKLAAEIGKFPDIPDANGASSGYKDETNAGGKRVHRIIAVVHARHLLSL